MINWLKFEGKGLRGEEPGLLIYLKPEALDHAMVIEDFEAFQSSPDFVPGGRLLDVRRQYSYKLRQVADLVEEPLTQAKAPEPEEATAEAPILEPTPEVPVERKVTREPARKHARERPPVDDLDDEQASLADLETLLVR